jgi:GNAT superfamily N-acetyltransferase
MEKQNIGYRMASIEDEASIIPMAHAFHSEDGHPLAVGSEDAIRAALRGHELGQVYLVESENQVLGYFVLCFTLSIEFGGLVVILDDLYLKPESRGKGIGQFLLKEIKKLAKTKNAVQIFLEIEHENLRANKIYLQSGFKIRRRGMMEYLI